MSASNFNIGKGLHEFLKLWC